MATNARPVIGLMPTAPGVPGTPGAPFTPGVSGGSGTTAETDRVLRSTMAIVCDVEFATNAIFRNQSTDTLAGPEGVEAGQGGVKLGANVQTFATTAGVGAVRSIKLTSLDPVFATTAMPVAGLMATSLGAEKAGTEPTGIRLGTGGEIEVVA